VQNFFRLVEYLEKLVSHKDAPEMDVKVASSKKIDRKTLWIPNTLNPLIGWSVLSYNNERD